MDTREHLPVEIAGIGGYLPERVLTNHDLEKLVDTSDAWIVPRTGIKERHIAADHQATSDLAIEASRAALASAGVEPSELDAILLATLSPDYLFPATACIVQAALKADKAMACDLEAACSGFVYGLSWASGMIGAGMAQNVLLVGAETLSRFTDYTDRGSCILFGDGAAAVVLRRARNGGEVLFMELGADGNRTDILIVPAGGSRTPATRVTVDEHMHFMKLEGSEVFKLAVGKLVELIQRIPTSTGISLDEIKMVIPHQSNARIISSVLERTGVDPAKAFMNIEHTGNTSAASIPLAMSEAVERGLLQRGDIVLLLAFGGGLTWGSVLLRY